ncbi:protein kinase (incomplete catalytic triad) [Cyclospora cayetanensis]|uniref:non-specific serine/threonine protein kinase n=1 Tax=Cyclospora cayetanensis TaxID=88456 RepID=A0A1D3D7H5_9EIME|nr:protein kinase (incomplete catalytic triad) [Cyclospora cayetanensis]
MQARDKLHPPHHGKEDEGSATCTRLTHRNPLPHKTEVPPGKPSPPRRRKLQHAGIPECFLKLIAFQGRATRALACHQKASFSRLFANKRHDVGTADLNAKLEITTRMCEQALDGLSFLHEQRVVHRDIKPQNILISDQGYVKLADLGVSRALTGDMDDPLTYVGTEIYMSPERLFNAETIALSSPSSEGSKSSSGGGRPHSTAAVAAAEDVSYKGDVWSLGVALLELATLSHPFKGGTPCDVADAAVAASLQQRLRGVYTPELRSFLFACLRVCPRKRKSAKELLVHPWLLEHIATPKQFIRLACVGFQEPPPEAASGEGGECSSSPPSGCFVSTRSSNTSTKLPSPCSRCIAVEGSFELPQPPAAVRAPASPAAAESLRYPSLAVSCASPPCRPFGCMQQQQLEGMRLLNGCEPPEGRFAPPHAAWGEPSVVLTAATPASAKRLGERRSRLESHQADTAATRRELLSGAPCRSAQTGECRCPSKPLSRAASSAGMRRTSSCSSVTLPRLSLAQFQPLPRLVPHTSPRARSSECSVASKTLDKGPPPPACGARGPSCDRGLRDHDHLEHPPVSGMHLRHRKTHLAVPVPRRAPFPALCCCHDAAHGDPPHLLRREFPACRCRGPPESTKQRIRSVELSSPDDLLQQLQRHRGTCTGSGEAYPSRERPLEPLDEIQKKALCWR